MPEWTEEREQRAAVPRTLAGRIGWLSARALNVQRRPMLAGATAAIVFVGALAGLMAIPHSAARAARQIAPQPHERPDTVPLVAELTRAQRDVRGAEEALNSARARIARWAALPPPAADTLTTEERVRRDSVALVAAGLEQLRERVETAPLLASYRALAESPELRGRPRVRQLLDSLAEIERAREQVGGVGGVDPVFVALTERASEIGREIRGIAEARLSVLRAEIDRIQPPPPPDPPPPPRVDTTGLIARMDSARTAVAHAESTLVEARQTNRELDDRAMRARAIAAIGASPFAIFIAALVLGLSCGFGVAFVAELRSPRIGTARELEWLAAAPLVGVMQDGMEEPERIRRRSDELLPPLLRRGADLYRDVYGSLADRAYNLAPTAIVSEDALIAAAVAASLATASARSARSTMLLDIDGDGNSVAALLGVAPHPGIADLLHRRADWTEAISTVLVGRDRVIDVIAAGPPLTYERMLALREPFSGEVEHFRRRYDTVVVSAPARTDGSPAPFSFALSQALVCVRAGRTPVRLFLRTLAALREQGVVVRGVLLWDAEDPEPVLAAAAPRAEPASVRV